MPLLHEVASRELARTVENLDAAAREIVQRTDALRDLVAVSLGLKLAGPVPYRILGVVRAWAAVRIDVNDAGHDEEFLRIDPPAVRLRIEQYRI